jgi:hypothetical protein
MKIRKRRWASVEEHNYAKSLEQKVDNLDTSARLRAVLAQLSNKGSIVLARVASETTKGTKYDICMGSNHTVFCKCKGWQYSKTGTCKHLERFKRERVIQDLK